MTVSGRNRGPGWNLNAESAPRYNQAIAFALIALLALPFLHVLDRFSYDFRFVRDSSAGRLDHPYG